jgi:hypothetical protein
MEREENLSRMIQNKSHDQHTSTKESIYQDIIGTTTEKKLKRTRNHSTREPCLVEGPTTVLENITHGTRRMRRIIPWRRIWFVPFVLITPRFQSFSK